MMPAVGGTDADRPRFNGAPVCLMLFLLYRLQYCNFLISHIAATQSTAGCRQGRVDPQRFTRRGNEGDLSDFECLFAPAELL